MVVLLENCTNCIWHAFAALQPQGRSAGAVPKTKLKVLTANLGTHLDLYGVEKGLDHFRSTATLTFAHFKYYLQQEVFATLPNRMPLTELAIHETRISETCWRVCGPPFIAKTAKRFSDHDLFQLFRIFCLLADLVETQDDCAVLLHPAEVSYVAHTLANSLGCHFDEEDFLELGASLGAFPFAAFVAILESRCLNSGDGSGGDDEAVAVAEAVHDLHQTFVEDVIKKGGLLKKGYIFSTMREYWFVLRPSELSYYKGKAEKERCGSMAIENGSKVEAKTGYKIVLHTPERTFELATIDHMTRLQWISALQLAIEHSGGTQSYQRLQANKRRVQRSGRIQEMLRARALLQHERNARRSAEGHAKELEAAVKEESRRLTELEVIKENLERLLVEETQAKRDEEIVRALQARVLAEEWEKRDELEKLQEEQRLLLEEERGKRREYEELQKNKENELYAATQRLRQLETERFLLDDQLRNAITKINLSEEKREILEARLISVAPSFRDGDKVRRAHSFIPSTKNRPAFLQVRAATLKRPPNQ